jgi:hypothetical protein
MTQAATGLRRPGTPRGLLLLPVLLPPLLFALLYARGLDNPFVWTDQDDIGGVGSLLRPAGQTLDAFREPFQRIELRGAAARQEYYRPLPVALLSLVDQRFGREPRVFRTLTIAAAALCLAAFGLLALRLLGRPGPALFAALFAALHPVAIEATLWISAVTASICALFVIAALGFAGERARAAPAAAPGSGTRAGPTSLAPPAALGLASLAALALALLSQERASVEPALFLALLVSLRLRARHAWLAALFVSHAALVALYLFVLRPAVLGSVTAGHAFIGGSAATQVLTALASWPARLGWLFLPLHSNTSDAVRIVSSPGDAFAWLGTGLLLASLGAYLLLWRARRGVAALGLAWIWIAHLPTSGLVPMLHAGGERYLYLSSFGAALFLAGLFPARAPAWRRPLALGLALALLALLGQRTHARISDWSSTRTLFEKDVARDPSFREAYFLLGAERFDAGDHAGAERWLAPLLGGDARFAGTWSYLNWLALSELVCANELARNDPEGALRLEAWLAQNIPAASAAATLRLCFARARAAAGRSEEALGLYLALARELGPAAPAGLPLWIAQGYEQLGRPRVALHWLAQARSAAGDDPALLREIQALDARLRHP